MFLFATRQKRVSEILVPANEICLDLLLKILGDKRQIVCHLLNSYKETVLRLVISITKSKRSNHQLVTKRAAMTIRISNIILRVV